MKGIGEWAYNDGHERKRLKCLRPAGSNAGVTRSAKREPALGKKFLEPGRRRVASDVSREGRWGWDGASLEHVSGFSDDPIGYRGGMNLYEYVGDAPSLYTDPAGYGVYQGSDGRWYFTWDTTHQEKCDICKEVHDKHKNAEEDAAGANTETDCDILKWKTAASVWQLLLCRSI